MFLRPQDFMPFGGDIPCFCEFLRPTLGGNVPGCREEGCEARFVQIDLGSLLW